MGAYYYESRAFDHLSYLEHYGVKGMKWGIRKQKDAINSNRRTIKSGTELQTITKGKYPLIIVNMNKLNHTGSMKLSKKI